MWHWRQLLRKLRNFLRPAQAENELRREVKAHIALIEDEFRRRGRDPEEARAAAIRAFGEVEQAKERQRDERSIQWLEHARQDIRYAFRALRNSPGFTFVAIAVLAIGIGSTTAAFSQVNALFWKTLAVEAPEDLRIVSWASPQQEKTGESVGLPSFSYSAYVHLRDRSRTFSELACWARVQGSVVEWGRFNVTVVSGNYFQTLGVAPVAGRSIGATDDRREDPALVAVVSHDIWQQAFSGDPDILSRTISIKGIPFQIIGVMPQGFAGLDPVPHVDVIVPHAAAPLISPFPREFASESWSACRVFGRLRAGVPDNEARTELDMLLQQTIRSEAGNTQRETARVSLADVGQINTLETQRQRTSLPVFVLLSTAGVILLVACANIAGLLFARGQARQREIATRLAMGAQRSRIVRQLLTESLLLSTTGGVCGIGFAYLICPVLPSLLAQFDETFWLGQPIGIDMTPDLRVLGFSIALSLLTGIAFGLFPALRETRVQLNSAMKQSHGIGQTRRFHSRTGKMLVAVQAALSMLLLVGAGLLIRTTFNLVAVPLGYEPDGVLFVNTVLDEFAAGPARVLDQSILIEATAEGLAGLPGVVSASASPWPIYRGGIEHPVCLPHYSSEPQAIDVEPVLPRFFETWGVPFRRGRDFASTAEPAVVLNETFARRFFGDADPLGMILETGGCPGIPHTIVGVVADSRNVARTEQPPMIYVPYPWEGGSGLAYGSGLATYAVRTTGDPRSVAPAMRRFFAGLGTNVVGDVTTGDEWKAAMIKREIALAGSLVFFGTIALLISCLGIYGMLAYSVNSRVSEIGIRMALGARRIRVIGMVVRESVAPVVVGILFGLMGAFGLSRPVESILFDVSTHDPWTLAGATTAFLLTAAAAAYLPVRRATRIDPASALRHE